MNLWPPFRFSSIRIIHIDERFRTVEVRLRKHRVTANYVGAQYGGSLYSMTDPFWMLMLMLSLGEDYVVWDRRGEIDFLSPGRTAVTARFHLTDDVLNEIRDATADGEKHLRWFVNDITAEDGTVVARVRKQVYVRLRQPAVRRPSGGEVEHEAAP